MNKKHILGFKQNNKDQNQKIYFIRNLTQKKIIVRDSNLSSPLASGFPQTSSGLYLFVILLPITMLTKVDLLVSTMSLLWKVEYHCACGGPGALSCEDEGHSRIKESNTTSFPRL